MKPFRTALLFPVIAGVAWGQAPLSGNVNLAAVFQAKQNAYANSAALFASHSYPAAVAALEAGNISAANTAEWHLESGCQLIQMALEFREQGDLATSGQIAQMALPEFVSAESGFSSSTSAGERANELINLAFAYENLLGNRAQALACYQRAAAVAPTNPQALAGMSRLTRALAVEARLRNHP